MIKYTLQGLAVEVQETTSTGLYLGRVMYEDSEGEVTYDELRVFDILYDKPPTIKQDEIIKKLENDIAVLHNSVVNAREEFRALENEYKGRIAKFKKYECLRNIELFIDGAITHCVIYGYHKSDIKILTIEECQQTTSYGKIEGLRLLSLVGNFKTKELKWSLSDYCDGSGSNITVIPCKSYEEAVLVVQEYINKFDRNIRECITVREADYLISKGINFSGELTNIISLKRKEEVERTEQERKKRILNLKKEIEKLETK